MKVASHFGLLGVALLTTINGFSQTPLHISGKFKPPVETTISIYKPVAGIFNTTVPDPKSEVVTQKGSFNVDAIIDKPGFVRLQGRGMPKTQFYAEPGGNVEVSIRKDNTGKVAVVYAGDNSAANNLLTTNTPIDNQAFLQYGLPKLFRSPTATELLMAVKQELKTATKPLETMLAKEKITQSCYDAMMREAEQTIVYWINVYLKNFLMPDRELPQVSKLSRDEVNRLATLLYTEYDPFDSRYLVATKTYDNQMIKASLIEDGIISGNSRPTQSWAPFAGNFSMIVSRLSAIDRAPDSVQMTFMGTSLLSAIAFKSMNDEEFLKVFNIYYGKFPASPFIPIITEHLSTQPAGETEIAADPEADILFLSNKGEKNIQEFIKNEFAGKPVFVDFWATWCGPCITEFQHEPALRKFLKQKNVVTLYVSIDNENAVGKWERAVNKYQLSGYHYLANKEFRANLDQMFSGIPRYMFFDSNGVLKDNGLPKPGSKGELYQRINELLGGQ